MIELQAEYPRHLSGLPSVKMFCFIRLVQYFFTGSPEIPKWNAKVFSFKPQIHKLQLTITFTNDISIDQLSPIQYL